MGTESKDQAIWERYAYRWWTVTYRFMLLHVCLAVIMPFVLAVLIWKGDPPAEITRLLQWGIMVLVTFALLSIVLPRIIQVDSRYKWLSVLGFCHGLTLLRLFLSPGFPLGEMLVAGLASPVLLGFTWLLDRYLEARCRAQEPAQEVALQSGSRIQTNRKRRSRRGRPKPQNPRVQE